MTIEATLTALLNPLVANRVWWDTLPDGYVIAVNAPVIIASQMGGDAQWHVDGSQPSHKHARIQLVVWARTRKEANTVARQIEATLSAAAEAGTVVAQPYSAFTGMYETDLKLYGNQQQFGFWYPSP